MSRNEQTKYNLVRERRENLRDHYENGQKEYKGQWQWDYKEAISSRYSKEVAYMTSQQLQ